MPAVTAFIADITTMETRSKALGYMSAAISTGFIIGPGIGGFLADFGTRVPFYFAGALGTTAAILSIILLREPERNAENMENAPVQTSGFKRILEPMYLIAFILIFVASFGLAAFESFFSLFVDHKLVHSYNFIAFIISVDAIFGVVAHVMLFVLLLRKW